MDSEISRAISLATQKVQKHHRLRQVFALGILIFVSACASSLIPEEVIVAAPEEYEQKIEVVDQKAFVKKEILPEPVESKKEEKKTITKKVPSKKPSNNKSKKQRLWTPDFWPFGVGERAEYSLRYGLIEGGQIVMTVEEIKKVDGYQVLHYKGHVKSTRLLELFYKVDDVIESWVRLDSHLPLRQEIKQRESAQWGRRVVTFDQKKQMSRLYSSTTKRESGKTKVEKKSAKVDNFSQDIYGALYFARFISPQDRINFGVHDRAKNWSNEMIYLETETLDLPIGRRKARKYKLNPRIQGNLKPKGDVEIWFADDETRVMLRFRAHLKFGSITGDLREYTRGYKIAAPLPKMRTPIQLSNMGKLAKSK